MSTTYGYDIHLDAAGSFLASVFDEGGRTVFSIRAGDELGEDETSRVRGIQEYLTSLAVMQPHDELLPMAEFDAWRERHRDTGNHATGIPGTATVIATCDLARSSRDPSTRHGHVQEAQSAFLADTDVLLLFEVTTPGFDGSTDATDDRVVWVMAPNSFAVAEAVRGLDCDVQPMDFHRDHDADFVLPLQSEALRERIAAEIARDTTEMKLARRDRVTAALAAVDGLDTQVLQSMSSGALAGAYVAVMDLRSDPALAGLSTDADVNGGDAVDALSRVWPDVTKATAHLPSDQALFGDEDSPGLSP